MLGKNVNDAWQALLRDVRSKIEMEDAGKRYHDQTLTVSGGSSLQEVPPLSLLIIFPPCSNLALIHRSNTASSPPITLGKRTQSGACTKLHRPR